MTTALVSSAYFSRLIARMRTLGLDVAEYARAVDLDPDGFDQHEALFDVHDVGRLFARVAADLGDPALGLRLARDAAASSYGVPGYLLRYGATLDAGFRAASEAYCRLVSVVCIAPEDVAGGVRFTLTFREELEGAWVIAQRDLATYCFQGSALLQQVVRPVEVTLRQAAPRDVVPFLEVFGVDPVFGAATDSITFDRATLDKPLPSFDPELMNHLVAATAAQEAKRKAALGSERALLRLRGCSVDLLRGEVRRGGEIIPLTTKERALLEYFSSRPGELVTHEDLEQQLWAIARNVVSHAPAVAIRRLRQKIEPKPRKPVNLVTVFGEGWRLDLPEGDAQG